MADLSPVELAVLRERLQAGWASGDYSVVGTTLQIVGEELCEAVDLRSGSRVLDVAAGNGNATLAAARRWCEVVSTDFVPALLEAAKRRADAEGHTNITFQEADAEVLPFGDGEFDVVLSTFGVVFALDAQRAADELLRVTKPGGRIGLANWTPAGFSGRMFKLVADYVPASAGGGSPEAWGVPERIEELFGAHSKSIHIKERAFTFRYHSPSHWLDVFRVYYGPLQQAFKMLDTDRHAALSRDLLHLVEQFNRADDGTLVLPSDYLEIVITKRG
jgi:SAM-dependent methyltransferase